MAKYHLTAEKLREKYDLKTFADKNPINLNLCGKVIKRLHLVQRTVILKI